MLTLVQQLPNPCKTAAATDSALQRPVSLIKQRATQDATVIWKRNPLGTEAARQFNLTDFAVTLNELPDQLRSRLPTTDSRLRPDQRAMEQAQYELADVEKIRLEES